jgi:hypothetical protein
MTQPSELTPEQLAHFEKALANIGLSRDQIPAVVRTSDYPGGLLLHADPDQSHLPPTLIEVKDIAELNARFGVPDAHYQVRNLSDAFVDYPPPPHPQALAAVAACGGDRCKLLADMEPEHLEQTRQAMRVYLMGDSAKVQDHEPAINAAFFPLVGAAFGAERIVVDKDHPLIIDSTDHQQLVTLSYGSITIQPGGQIIVKTPANVTAGLLDKQS